MVFKICIVAFILCLRASSANDHEWTAEIPKSVVGLSGSCVVIPCKFNHPSDGKTSADYTGIWYNGDSNIVYHKETSKIISKFKGRTRILGDLHQKNCTLKIKNLQHDDSGSYKFRIEVRDFDKATFKNVVFVTVKDSEQPKIFMEEEVTSQREVTATCVVSHTCPLDPPRLTWGHKGPTTTRSQQQENGQWRLTSSLTFTASREDDNKPINCSATFSGGKTAFNNKNLRVKYPPYNVNVQSKAKVKENETVDLTCFSDSNPPAHGIQWFSLNGSLLGNERIYRLDHMTRYTEAISCTATNTEGQTSSAPHKCNVLYPPDIKPWSSCRSETFIVCVCVVDSNPSSEVKWLGPSSSFPSSSVEQNGSLTVFTLQGWLGFPDTVHCSASNSEGNSVVTLSVLHHGLVLYLCTAAVVVIFVLIFVCFATTRRWCKAKQQNDQNKTKTIQKSCLDREEQASNDIYTNYQDVQHVYTNDNCIDRRLPPVPDEDEAVYANT